MVDDPTPEEQRKRFEEREGDALDGMVFMSGDQVAWAGPQAVIGTEADATADHDHTVNTEELEDMGVADGSEYTPPQEEQEGD